MILAVFSGIVLHTRKLEEHPIGVVGLTAVQHVHSWIFPAVPCARARSEEVGVGGHSLGWVLCTRTPALTRSSRPATACIGFPCLIYRPF